MLRHIFKSILKTIVSILRVLKSFIKFGYYKTEYGFLSDRIKLKDTCLVLGNGPSLINNIDDVFKYITADKLVVNNFADTEYYTRLKPRYYILLDPIYYCAESVLSEQLKNNRSVVFNNIIYRTTWTMVLFLPSIAKSGSELEKYISNSNNENIKVVYFNCSAVDGFKFLRHWMYKRNFGMPNAQNVLVSALYILLNVGYKTIFLFGADHSWLENLVVNDSNILCFKDKHFYNEHDNKYKPFYKNMEETETFNMSEALTAFSLMFNGYYVIKEYADFLNARIFNATRNSFIDAFDRLKL